MRSTKDLEAAIYMIHVIDMLEKYGEPITDTQKTTRKNLTKMLEENGWHRKSWKNKKQCEALGI